MDPLACVYVDDAPLAGRVGGWWAFVIVMENEHKATILAWTTLEPPQQHHHTLSCQFRVTSLIFSKIVSCGAAAAAAAGGGEGKCHTPILPSVDSNGRRRSSAAGDPGDDYDDAAV